MGVGRACLILKHPTCNDSQDVILINDQHTCGTFGCVDKHMRGSSGPFPPRRLRTHVYKY